VLINYAHNAKIFTSTSTNAQLLNSERAKELVLSGLDKLIVSIDGTTQEVYEQYRKGGKLIKAIEGVHNINNWKKELKSITPLVEIQFIVLKTNEHQMKEMKILAKSLKADRLVFKSAQLYDFENGNDLLTSIEKYSRYKKINEGSYKVKSALPNHCSRLWSAAVISSKGDLIPCCYDKDGTHSFGNLADRSFGSVWHSSKANEFRMSVLSNRKQHEMCRNCTGK
jgi:radical SAM protein with 4Fe4S-binding SPASM domain